MPYRIYRTAISFALAVVLFISLIPVSFAYSSYSANQFYSYNSYNTKVYTIQFSAGKNLKGAEKNRDSMLSYDKDAFVYSSGEWYYVMTGKFRDYDEAKSYLKTVQKIKGADDGYITSAYLPEYAINEFEDLYYGCNSWPGSTPSWYYPVEDWYIYVPRDFDRLEYTGNSVAYYSNYLDMYFSVTPEVIAATSAKSRSTILSNAYSTAIRSYPYSTYQELSDDHYDISGYNGNYIYYVRGIVTSDHFYTIYFYYPSSNRRYCDSLLESIRDSFSW